MFAVVEEDVEGHGFGHAVLDLRLDDGVKVSWRMLVVQVVFDSEFLSDDVERVELHCGVQGSAEEKQSGVRVSDGQMSHVRNSVSFTVVNSIVRKEAVAGKLQNVSGVQLEMRVIQSHWCRQ